MPRGDVHNTVNGILLYGLYAFSHTPVARKALTDDQIFALLSGYTIGAYWLTPDLDMAGDQPVWSLRLWGPLRVIWYPYGWLFRHRGLSHDWVLGPLTRLLYLLLLLAPVLQMAGAFRVVFDTERAPLWLAGLTGYYLSQWAHLVLDLVYARPRGRARTKRGRKRIRTAASGRS